jgi:hypothetical protein
MSHLDPDDLALIALSPSSATRAQRVHLEDCDECSREEQSLMHTAELGRSLDDSELLSPPPTAWKGIHTTLGLSVAEAEPVHAAASAAAATPSSVGDRRKPARVPSAVVPVDSRPRRRVWPLLIAAVLVGVLGGFGAGALSNLFGERFAVIAEAKLEPLPGQHGAGSARVEVGSEGQRDIVVTVGDGAVPSDPADTTLREVWLLNADASGLVSLGLLDGSSGRFVLPAGVDIDEFSLVDVSVEFADGDPGHSGDSVVRGQLHSS